MTKRRPWVKPPTELRTVQASELGPPHVLVTKKAEDGSLSVSVVSATTGSLVELTLNRAQRGRLVRFLSEELS